MAPSDRVAFVTMSRGGSGPRDAQGNLDAEAIAERLGQRDAAFSIVMLDAGDDIGAQIDDHLSARSESPPSAVLFYASSDAIASEGELLVQLDPTHPDTADALADIVSALTESSLRPADGSTLLLLDLRSPSSDVLELAELANEARKVSRAASSAVELIVSVRTREDESVASSSCSPLTWAILRHLDDADPEIGLFALDLVEPAFESARSTGRAGALAHASVADSFEVIVAEEASPHPRDAEASAPSSEDDGEPSNEDADPARASDLDWDSQREAPITMPSALAPSPTRTSPPPPASAASTPAASTPVASTPAASIPAARPSTPPPTAKDLVAEADAFIASDHPEDAIAKLRRALALVATSVAPASADDERARIHLRLGDAMLRLGRGRDAIASYEKALSLGPDVAGAERALRSLLTLYLGEGDRHRVSSVEERLLGRLDPQSNDLVQALIGFGRAWMVDLNEPLRARERLEHARALAPQNREVVRLLLTLAEKDDRAEDVVSLKRTLAELDPDPKSRAISLSTLGRELLSRGREDDALDLFDAALESDASGLEPLEVLSRVLGERQEWSELEAAYRRMLERAARIEDASLQRGLEHELNKRLGLMLMQHLEDSEGAFAAFEAASEARPGELGVRRAAAELAVRLGRAEVAERHLLALVALDPRDVEAYRLLFDLFVRTERIERAVDAGAVLTRLGVANDRERVLVSAHDEDEVGAARAVLTDEDWVLLRSSLDPQADPTEVELVAGVFRAAGDALVKAFAHLASRAERLAPLDESLRVDPETSTVSVVRSLVWASQLLGLEPPAIYLEDSSSEGMRTVLREHPVTIVGSSALRGRSIEELRFLAGHELAGHVPEHRIVQLAPNIDDVAACFLAAVVIAVPDTPVPERVRSLVELIVPAFAAFLAPESEAALEEAVMAFDAAGGRADLLAFQRAVERASLRAGWLLCQELDAAIEGAQSMSTPALAKTDRESELLSFSVSDAAVALRAKMYGP